MATLTRNRLLSYEEYLSGPTVRQRFEIIDGVIEFMAPAPNKAHQVAVGEFYALMRTVTAGHGQVFLAPFDVIISRRPLRTRQPDLFYVRNERLHIVKDQVEDGPDVVVEIISPSNRRKAVVEKLADYARIGVRECWMVDILENRNLQIWRNESQLFRPVAVFAAGQRVRSEVVPEFELPALVFPQAD